VSFANASLNAEHGKRICNALGNLELFAFDGTNYYATFFTFVKKKKKERRKGEKNKKMREKSESR